MVELTIKVKTEGWEDIIGIKETVAVALEEIHGVTDVEVVDVELKGD
jgi:hypothetical protein